MPLRATLHFDGACRGNPGGPSAGAAILTFNDTSTGLGSSYVTAHGALFHGTNNEAEYHGLLAGLHEALKLGVRHLQIFGDSKMVIEQISGRWRCKAPHLQALYTEAITLLRSFESWSAEWIPREQNRAADRASNEAIDNPRRIQIRRAPPPDPTFF